MYGKEEKYKMSGMTEVRAGVPSVHIYLGYMYEQRPFRIHFFSWINRYFGDAGLF